MTIKNNNQSDNAFLKKYAVIHIKKGYNSHNWIVKWIYNDNKWWAFIWNY